jgi:hypothetical protein
MEIEKNNKIEPDEDPLKFQEINQLLNIKDITND